MTHTSEHLGTTIFTIFNLSFWGLLITSIILIVAWWYYGMDAFVQENEEGDIILGFKNDLLLAAWIIQIISYLGFLFSSIVIVFRAGKLSQKYRNRLPFEIV